MDGLQLHHGAATHVGLVREVNEDSLVVNPPVFVVADGMGGHHGGDVASRMVTEEFQRLRPSEMTALEPRVGAELIAAALTAGQTRIEEYAHSQRAGGLSLWYSGTTAVAALLVEEYGEPRWLVANLGDSRAYRVHNGELRQVSVDHSVVQELYDAGVITAQEMTVHPDRHVVTRALGGPERPYADYFLFPASSGERLLLCSDGITGMLDDSAVAAILTSTPDPEDAAGRLVQAAVEAGGRDNATAIVIDVVGLAPTDDHDQAPQPASLEQKLGALP